MTRFTFPAFAHSRKGFIALLFSTRGWEALFHISSLSQEAITGIMISSGLCSTGKLSADRIGANIIAHHLHRCRRRRRWIEIYALEGENTINFKRIGIVKRVNWHPCQSALQPTIAFGWGKSKRWGNVCEHGLMPEMTLPNLHPAYGNLSFCMVRSVSNQEKKRGEHS